MNQSKRVLQAYFWGIFHNTREILCFNGPYSQSDTEFMQSGESQRLFLLNHFVTMTIEKLPSAVFPSSRPSINPKLPFLPHTVLFIGLLVWWSHFHSDFLVLNLLLPLSLAIAYTTDIIDVQHLEDSFREWPSFQIKFEKKPPCGLPPLSELWAS